MTTRVKICGLTRPEDVRAACAAGADAVGFVCYPKSPRFVPADRLAQLAAAVAPFVTPVLLFVDAAAGDIDRALAAVPDALLQFHGDETPAQCRAPGRRYLKAVAMADGVDLLDFDSRYADAAGLLVDTPAAGFGGSGRVFDWTRLPAVALRRRPLILAGGLSADNVGQAVGAVRPYAVDVSSGVEQAPGVKSVQRMRDFIAAVRAADARDGAG